MSAVTIRRATVDDAAAFARVMGEPGVLYNLMQLPHASDERWRNLLTEIAAPGKPDIVLVAEWPEADGTMRVVGNAGLHASGNAVRRRHVMNVGIAVAADAQGRGVGRALMTALIDYADRWAQVLRLELTVFADNQRAIGLYESLGFKREGLHIGFALRDGHFADALSMARLHPNPPRWDVCAG